MGTSRTKKIAINEGLKEFLRLMVIGAVSGGLAAATVAVGLVTDPAIAMGLGTFLAFAGKAWDKYVHKNPESESTGITGF